MTSVSNNSNGSLSILAALRGKHVFLTGSTGFVGKVIVEKLLRDVPEIGGIYVLVRPRKGSTAEERMQQEILSSPIFTRLRAERGASFDPFVNSKLHAMAGELTQSEVGLSKRSLEYLYENLDVLIHCAAIVDFNERIDRAIELNVLGSLRLLDIAKRCKHLGAFIHVSTAYVNSNRRGWIDEKVYQVPFDPEEVLKKVEKMNVSELEKVTVTGLLGDWPNTYTYTKAMCENLLVSRRGTVPLAIVRPSIIGSSEKEPVPGWVDVITAAGAVYMSVGLGVLKFLPGSPNNTADVVPVDYVVNAILAAIPAIQNQDRYFVAHACSSTEKPLTWGQARPIVQGYFITHPPARRIGPPEFSFISSPQNYQLQFFLRYSVPSSILNTLAAIGPGTYKSKADQYAKLVWRVRVIIESFRHFVENEWQFDNRNTRALGQLLNDEERRKFPLSLKDLDWDDYNWKFAYGLMKFVLQADLVDVNLKQPLTYETLSQSRYRSPRDSNSLSDMTRHTFEDFLWAASHYSERASHITARSIIDMRALILSSSAVQATIKQEAASNPKTTINAVEARAKAICDRMFGDISIPVTTGMGYFFKKVWRRIYESIRVESVGLAKLRAIASQGPIIFVPTHRSYVDFLVISYICFACNLPLPFIAAGEDFLGILLVRWLFRRSGAFFIRRSFAGDDLYSSIFQTYVERLLMDGCSLEFFIEGTRSRSGKMLHPKMGLLSTITNAYLDGKINQLNIVPIAINYEKTVEGDLYSNELLGDNKIRESLRSLLSSSSILNLNFGMIDVTFADPIPIREYTAKHMGATPTLPATHTTPQPSFKIPPAVQAATLANKQGLPTSSTSSQLSTAGASASASATDTDTDTSSATLPSAPPSTLSVVPVDGAYDPIHVVEHRKHYNRKLAYTIVYQMSVACEAMPTHLVATLLLMYRQGITRSQLVSKVEWLRLEVISRGGRVAGFECEERSQLVENAVRHLNSLVVQRRQAVLEPAISARHEYKNMLVLGHYRNKIMHLFFMEGLWAVALYSFGQTQEHQGVDKLVLLEEVRFLYALLHREFIWKENPDEPENLESHLGAMMVRGILKLTDDNKVEVAPTGEAHFSFLCAILWPFVDSYFAATMSLYQLQPDRVIDENMLLQRTQWLATTLYHESMLCFYEACSLDTLRNAFSLLGEWHVIRFDRKLDRAKGNKTPSVQLLPPYQSSTGLNQLVARLDRLRKQPAVKKNLSRTNLIADIPILAKL